MQIPSAHEEHRLDRVPVGALIVGVLLAILVFWFALLEHIKREESDAIAGAATANANLARAFQEHVLRKVQFVDLQSRTVAAEVERKGVPGIDLGANQSKIARALPANQSKTENALPSVLQIATIDASGYLSASSLPMPPGRNHVGDTEHFRFHAKNDSKQFFVGTPLVGHTGKWSIPMTRRLNTPNGAFAGVLVFSVDPEYLSHFFGEASLGKSGATVLYH